MASQVAGDRTIATNRRARHEYHILETIEAGLVLRGTEVKSLRAGGVNFKDSYATIRSGEGWLLGCHINPYSRGSDAARSSTTSARRSASATRSARWIRPREARCAWVARSVAAATRNGKLTGAPHARRDSYRGGRQVSTGISEVQAASRGFSPLVNK